MAWVGYRLVYRALSPVHIGSYTLGYINLTRPYITGKAMWGAMTANLARTSFKPGDYARCGELLRTKVLMSYFYPALDPNRPFLPRYTPNGLYYGPDNMSSQEFERRFVSSMGQTAIVPCTTTAEDATLHESEYIVSQIKNTEGFESLLFVGHVFVQDKCIEKEVIEDSWGELFVGGDRKYGWGRLRLSERDGIVPCDSLFGHELVIKTDERLVFEFPADCAVVGHIPVNDTVQLKGDMELLVGRAYDIESGFGHKVEGVGIHWAPGSIVLQEQPLALGPHGLLQGV